MNLLYLTIGIAIGATLAWFYAKSKLQHGKSSELDELKAELESEKELRIRTEAAYASQIQQSEENEKRLKDTFESMASKSLQNSNEQFIQLANSILEKHVSKASDDYDKRKDSISEMLKPLCESLDKHERMVTDIQNNNSKTYGSLRTHLEGLSKSQQSLEKETNALVSALKAPKVRGRWGEIGLKRLVEFSGLSSYCDFNEQVNVNTSDGKLRPDMVVNLPDNKQIVVDSKVPLNAYLEALEIDDETARNQLLDKHAKTVAQHMRDLSSKAYWSQFSNTVDFVVLYIEVEPAFAAAMMQNKDLVQQGISNRIIFATPTTLVTMLQTVAYTWRQHKATENAIEIWQSAKEFYERVANFAKMLNQIGKNIGTLTDSYNKAVGSWDSRLLPQLKKMEELGVSSEKKEIEDSEPVEKLPREVGGSA